MTFLNPWLLLGVLGISIPILIHLLTRLRPRTVRWAAMELLRRAVVVRSRRLKLEDLLILALRCLAIALIAVAMARPALTGSKAGILGGRIGVIIAVDGSFSMGYKPGLKSRFDRALECVEAIRRGIKPGDAVSLLLMGEEPRVLLRNAYDELEFDEATGRLRVLQEKLNLDRCLEEVEAILREMKAAPRECYIITDAQRISWGDLPDGVKRRLGNIASESRLIVVDVGDDGDFNLSIKGFRLASGLPIEGAWGRYVVEVWNPGGEARRGVEVKLRRDGEVVGVKVIGSIGPGEVRSISFPIRFDRAGYLKLKAELGWDPLEIDNSRYLVTHVRSGLRVLCVDGSPSDIPYRGETGYLRAALASMGSGGVSVEVVGWGEAWEGRVTGCDAVILANPPDITPQQVESLKELLAEGKGFALFLGDRISPRRLVEAMGPLLPGELIGPMEGEWPLELGGSGDRISEALKMLPSELVGIPRIRRVFKAKPVEGASIALKLAGTDIPLLLAREVGGGRVLMFTSSADRDWTDLPVHPVYPILIHGMLAYLVFERPEEVIVGGRMAVPIEGVRGEILLRDPSGGEIGLRAAGGVGRYGPVEMAGFYEFEGGVDRVVVAANVDVAESDIDVLSPDELREELGDLQGVEVVGGGAGLEGIVRGGRSGGELWRVLICLGLASLIGESILTGIILRRSTGFSDNT